MKWISLIILSLTQLAVLNEKYVAYPYQVLKVLYASVPFSRCSLLDNALQHLKEEPYC